MRIGNIGYYDGKDFWHHYPSDSSSSRYIPIQAIKTGKLVTKGSNSVFLYDLIITRSDARTTKLVSRLIDNMLPQNFVKTFKFTNYEEATYYSTQGQLIAVYPDQTVEVVVQLCIRKDQMFNVQNGDIQPDQLCVLINKKFIDMKIFRVVNKNYLNVLDASIPGIDTLFTNNIIGLCYSGKAEAPKAKTIMAYMEECSNVNQQLNELSWEIT